MKYKIGMTIDSQMLFALIAKLMPSGIDHFDVQEKVVEPPKWEHQEIAKELEKPKLKPKRPHSKHNPFKHPSGKPLVFFVEEYLNKNRDRELSWRDLGNIAFELGFSKSSINNAIKRLMNKKIMERTTLGKYRIIEHTTKKVG